MDDYKKYKRDKEINNEKYLKLVGNQFVEIECCNLCPGDIIYIEKNQRVPADTIILKASNLDGQVFIRTDQLDGETDWKSRNSVPYIQNSIFETLKKIAIEVEEPNQDIYNFFGRMIVYNENNPQYQPLREPQYKQEAPELVKECFVLSLENTMWMNTVLASGHVVGMVVYSGEENRSVLNRAKPRQKLGIFDKELNSYFLFLFFLSICIAMFFTSKRRFSSRIDIPFIRFLVLSSSVIPISLKTSVELARYFHTYIISRDLDVTVRNSNVPEELGRISYLLTDKTGTLTKNEMLMKKIHLGTVCYSIDTFQEISENLMKFYKKEKGRKTGICNRVFEICEALSICHSVSKSEEEDSSQNHDSILRSLSLEKIEFKRDLQRSRQRSYLNLTRSNHISPLNQMQEESVIDFSDNILSNKSDSNLESVNRLLVSTSNYQASSPDEIAIVRWSEMIGMKFSSRTTSSINVIDPLGNKNTYKILDIFPFTSESKRMGIIVEKKDKIVYYLKGADTVMREVVEENDWLDEETENMARDGLRTLVIAKKIISLEEYNQFSNLLKQSKLSGDKKQISNAMKTIEKDMCLLGITGVEDLLQKDVKISLESLKNAGIKIWMLTGDKLETAISIAISSRIFTKDSKFLVVKQLKQQSDGKKVLEKLDSNAYDSLVIDGDSVDTMLNNFPKEFIYTASKLDAFVGCRCSPSQKAVLTKLLSKLTKKRVAAIGDGGNDVSMIMEANIGFGIVGKEGKQASLAADYSMLQFKDTVPLLIWHGRRCYKSTTRLIHLIIHRGTVLFVMQMIFCSVFFYSPITIYPGMLLIGYSTFYTFGPIFCTVLSTDISKSKALRYPELYKDLVNKKALGLQAFFEWLFFSFYQGSVIMIGNFYLFKDELYYIISLSFTSLIINEIFMVVLVVNGFNMYMFGNILFSIFIYATSILFLPSGLITFPSESKILFMLKVLGINLCAIVVSFVHTFWKRYLNPPNYYKL